MKMSALSLIATGLFCFNLANAQPPSKLFPFSMEYDSTLTLIRVVDAPTGCIRYPESKMNEFQAWLSNLPLRALSKPVISWDGQKVMNADSITCVIDLGIGSPHQTDPCIPLQLAMEYLRAKGSLANYPVIIGTGDTLTYQKWLDGRYAFSPRKTIIYTAGDKRKESEKEYYKFMEFVFSQTSGRSLLLNLTPVEEKDLAPGMVFVQFKKDDRDSAGHTAVVLDVCTDKSGQPLVLAGWGSTPAASFFVARPWPPSEKIWFTIPELEAQLSQYGEGRFYRFTH